MEDKARKRTSTHRLKNIMQTQRFGGNLEGKKDTPEENWHLWWEGVEKLDKEGIKIDRKWQQKRYLSGVAIQGSI